ncbi:MAG: hypothetical protein RLY86_2431 [Pseudomonadota bacterium]|jgi:hypothetical protein
MPFMDRDSFIQLLDRLGDPDDAVALAAARDVHQRMVAAGVGWDALLIPAPGAETAAEDGDDDTVAATHHEIPAGDAADAALIDRLLADHALSDDTRLELHDLKGDLEAGEFTAADSKYLRDLAARLSRRKAG